MGMGVGSLKDTIPIAMALALLLLSPSCEPFLSLPARAGIIPSSIQSPGSRPAGPGGGGRGGLVLLCCSENNDVVVWQKFSKKASAFASNNGLIYIRNFLPKEVFEEVASECGRLKGKLALERSSFASGRKGAYMPQNGKSCMSSLRLLFPFSLFLATNVCHMKTMGEGCAGVECGSCRGDWGPAAASMPS